MSPLDGGLAWRANSFDLRRLHRLSACLVGCFAVLHIVNHLASLVSIDAHMGFMEASRRLYRQPAVEALLLSCVGIQAVSGLVLVVAGWRKRSGEIAWLQAASGAYLAVFLLLHVAAVLIGRAAFDLDTNFYFAAAGLHVSNLKYFFAPYYGLAVMALFAHASCAAYWRLRAPSRAAAVAALLLTGAVVSAAVVLSLAGKLRAFEVPPIYLKSYAVLRSPFADRGPYEASCFLL